MTRAEKSFASARRFALGFWRLHGRSPLTGRMISAPSAPSPASTDLPGALTGDSVGIKLPDRHAPLPSVNLPAAKRQLRPTQP